MTKERMDHLDELEAQSIYVIREAYHAFEDLCMLWSIGKDSTASLWLARKAFLGRVPFAVLHIDTSFKFPEMYAFREHYAREWNLDLHIGQNTAALAGGLSYATHDT